MPTNDTEVSLRDSLDSAFSSMEEKEKSETTEAVSSEETKVREETNSPAVKSDEVKAKETAEAKKDLPEIRAATPAKAEEPSPPTKTEASPQPKLRPPGGWKATAREKWGALDPEIQAEVLRREKEISNGFNEITKLKQFSTEITGVLNQYQNIINAEGGQPLNVINNLFTTASALYNGAPLQKAQVVAGLIRSFGVDLTVLDGLLAGEQPPPAGGDRGLPFNFNALLQQEVQKAINPLLAPLQQQEKAREQEAEQTLEEFSQDAKNEFFEDVRETMADLLEVSAKRGQRMDLSTAYNRAILMHSDIAEVVQQRALVEKAAKVNAEAQAAKSKAVSVSGAPATRSSGESSGSIRDALNSAFENLS